ncbi:DUF63 family protein [Candidatus Nanohaloarchaea archaeon]|nr:DUF63 family protein [Candidatus Nanohaloarchaea archaeon]
MIEKILNFLWKYIAGPIIADAKNAETAVWNGVTAQTGYNIFNTAAWGILAALFGYLIYREFDRRNIRFTPETVVASVPFILMGGMLRFIEDTGAIVFSLRPFLITPVIYFVIAGIYVISFVGAIRISKKHGKDRDRSLAEIGTLFLTPVALYTFYLLFQFGINWSLLVISILIPGAMLTGFYWLHRDTDFGEAPYYLIAFSQFFGGAVSMVSVSQGYVQKQLLAQFSTQLFGAPGILLVKTGLLAAVLYVLKDGDEDEITEAVLILALTVVGLATGLRVLLRLIVGI